METLPMAFRPVNKNDQGLEAHGSEITQWLGGWSKRGHFLSLRGFVEEILEVSAPPS
jgi:hypothetical protein